MSSAQSAGALFGNRDYQPQAGNADSLTALAISLLGEPYSSNSRSQHIQIRGHVICVRFGISVTRDSPRYFRPYTVARKLTGSEMPQTMKRFSTYVTPSAVLRS
jgi:hypothetical protein